ncbi:hemolysin XhlA family protein [Caryophanon tenue]|uniref:Hemolysin XhlA n=1 Tax=Caryophanon tenue TaxID=33978 RepID=A0A1C0Y574_9BACL|nr:hemolysin XhlA family protein [Caryophanon tenue]OCS82286.1 hypothetical protein A6M13_07580 [Caryophanon tenue]
MESNDKILVDISERLARLETKIDGIGDTRDIANRAMALSEANQTRLDKIDKITFWAGTTIIGAVILALIGVIFVP